MADVMPYQPDFFAASPCSLDGLRGKSDVIALDEELDLIARINASGLAPFAFKGWLGKRMTASFGSAYDYTKGQVLPAPPVPQWLWPVRARIARWAGVLPDALAQVLIIRYDPEAGIGWHRDRPQYGKIFGLSLGSAAILRLRRRRPDGGFDRLAYPLQPRASYQLDGPARMDWEHSIAPASQTRWSVTFRTLRDQSAQ